jgi:hypothetical protein
VLTGRGVGVGVAARVGKGVEVARAAELPVALGVTLAVVAGVALASAWGAAALPRWRAGPSVSQLDQINTPTRTMPQILPTSRATAGSRGVWRPLPDRAETGLSLACAGIRSDVPT